ncbi:nuclear condensing complex subunit [Mycena metata]|uniref:Nuclear condensing complex subunit n=1 Tax=Mycena metata TaxID=1033252 RepID=A0AAD7IMJ9_9AGAR|nr:nuclear condensing complex subunit [Mycena metata]
MPARTLPPAADLHTAIPRIFDQVQTTTANHQKNFVALHKLHLEAAKKKELIVTKDGEEPKYIGEREFQTVFHTVLARVLPIKKGATAADRVVKFVGGYTKFINERAAEDKADADDNDDSEGDTTASRFTAILLKFLLKGFQAKDKNVRYRVISLAGELIFNMGELDVDIYANLQAALLDRIHDKEATIRMQVVLALSKLAGSEDVSELAEGEESVLQVLTDTLLFDPSPDVRRATMVNLSVNEATLPALLTRARDTETTIRKLLYSSVLDTAATGAAHPRILTVSQFEFLIRHGLGDREPAVRAAAATLLGTWFEVFDQTTKPEEELVSRMTDVDISKTEGKPPVTSAERQQKIIEMLTTFLSKFDLQLATPDGSAELQGGELASLAVKSLFETRPDIFEDLHFGDAFFKNPSPEQIFLARVFVEHCGTLGGQGEEKMENASIPVVSAFAFLIQEGYNALIVDEEHDPTSAEESEEKEFIISEMLRLAQHLDYSDESGKRKMFPLVRAMLARVVLPLDLVTRCLDVLLKIWDNEREFIRVVVEIIQDLREPGDAEDEPTAADQSQDSINLDDLGDRSIDSDQSSVPKKPVKPREEMSSEERQRLDEIDLRCLALCIGMLERVNGTLDENSTLQGILSDLIVPSVQSKDSQFREKGVVAMGLLCIIAKPFALQSVNILVAQAESDAISEVLKISLLRIIFDLLMIHYRIFLAPGEEADKKMSFLIAQLQKEADKEQTSPKIIALLCTGLVKLLMNSMIPGDQTVSVKSLLMVYFSPYNATNQELKQCLAYFVQAYPHSSLQNQQIMREIFISVFQKVSKLHRALEGEEDVVSPALLTSMWLDWTDHTKVLNPRGQPGEAGDPFIQFEMANDVLRALLTGKMQKDEKKVLCQMLGKLHIPDEVDVDKVRTLKLLIDYVASHRPLEDATSKNALKRFEQSITKKFEKELEGFSEAEYRQLEKLKDLFDFLDDIIPEEDDDDAAADIKPKADVKKKGKKRRSGSITSIATDADDVSVASTSKRGKSKPKTKRRRLSTSDDEESDFDDDDNTPKGTPPPPTRRLPKRSAAVKKPEVIVISSDDQEDDDDDTEATPAPRKKGRVPAVSARTRKVKEEARLDAEIDDLLDVNQEPSGEIPYDSIMDDSDEEDEVNDLLVAD